MEAVTKIQKLVFTLKHFERVKMWKFSYNSRNEWKQNENFFDILHISYFRLKFRNPLSHFELLKASAGSFWSPNFFATWSIIFCLLAAPKQNGRKKQKKKSKFQYRRRFPSPPQERVRFVLFRSFSHRDGNNWKLKSFILAFVRFLIISRSLFSSF